LEITALDPEVKVRKFPQSPIDEITERVDNFARLRSYVFNEEKQLFLDGLLAKKERFGDFYCPCRFDNIPENICPARKPG
jgi:ferredoxin-thioredoxin reductase catalytic subunit